MSTGGEAVVETSHQKGKYSSHGMSAQAWLPFVSKRGTAWNTLET